VLKSVNLTALDVRTTQTPLIPLDKISRNLDNFVFAKLESCNPTGSHKDRESQAMIKDILARDSNRAVIASTGNAAISLSALAPCEGISVDVFLSKNIEKERLGLISAFSPRIHLVPGGYDEAYRESEAFAEKEEVYNANPGRNKFKIIGDSEIGREIMKQLGLNSPDYIFVPSNNGTLIAGVWLGSKHVRPRMIAAVAPKSRLMSSIAGYHRLDGQELERTVSESGGQVVPVSDLQAASALEDLRFDGVFCEPASAASLAALKKLGIRGKTVVLVITGTAFKFIESYASALGQSHGRKSSRAYVPASASNFSAILST
jgi:threonine synthase